MRNDQRNSNRGALAAVITTLSLTAAMVAAQAPELPAPSPLARVEQRVGVTDFSVEYSSPGVKGRTIWGELVPYEQLWRTGANAATKLEASTAFSFGDKEVPAGKYALFTIPGKTSWTVILNSNYESGGTRDYDEKKDVARITVTPEAVPHRERMTFIFSNTTDDTTRLDLEWEKLRISIPIEVKTMKLALTNVDKALDNAWRPHFASARWLLDNNGDLDKALSYVDTSIQIKPTWWNNWVRAQVLAKQGKSTEAIAAAEKAQALGKGDEIYEGFFKESVSKAVAGWKAS